MNPYESGAIIDMNAARRTVPTPVDADAPTEQCTIGVGDGTGSLFVHGSYEAIKRVQAIIHENERLRVKNDAAKTETADVGEPVAFAHFAENGNIRLWAPERPRDLDGNIAQPLYTADQLAAAAAAAVAKERERAAMVCERIADDYNRSDCLTYPELMTDAGTGANDCAAAIRAGAKEASDA